ncbi:MAG: class I SAM-dependent methyltransferase [Opitutaceae bacterium]
MERSFQISMKPETRTTLDALFPPPEWTKGKISHEDACFLAELLESGLSRPMIEIGVASGWSSAVLLHLLQRCPPADGDQVWLHSYDVGEWCYFDRSRRVGAAVREVAPLLESHWRLHVGNAIDAGLRHREQKADVAFIDADHRHPWATVDLLALLPALAPNAWVALHDVNLPEIAAEPEWRVYGPKHLFDLWPWEKRLAEGRQRNIGAVRVPAEHGQVRQFCATVFDRPWETTLPQAIAAAIGLEERPGYRIGVDPAGPGLVQRLRGIVDDGRPIFVWGAGGAGRTFLGQRPQVRALVSAFVDSSSAKQGTVLDGLPIVSPAEWSRRSPRPYILVTSQFAAEIIEDLERRGARADSDFLVIPT